MGQLFKRVCKGKGINGQFKAVFRLFLPTCPLLKPIELLAVRRVRIKVLKIRKFATIPRPPV
jgi:hypothetical protein